MLSEICAANCGRWCLVELMVTERMLEPSRFPVTSEAEPEVKVADPYLYKCMARYVVPATRTYYIRHQSQEIETAQSQAAAARLS